MEQVRIPVGEGYDVLIGPGLIREAGQRIAAVHAPCRAAVITDDTVAALYGFAVTDSLRAAGFSPCLWQFPHGETHKTMQTLAAALDFLCGSGVSRGDLVIALGGGVPGDLAGFAAAVYCRGIPFVQIPTTLLSAVDASVGGKTAVDLPGGKNMAGAFHQPLLVLCDTDVLRALPPALLRDGCAEMLKHGMLADEALFDALRTGAWKREIGKTVARNVEIKRDHVVRDEKDRGVRQLLNLGHTFGHAIECCSGFALSHGQGVAMGMILAARAAGMDPSPLTAACKACGLPTECPYPAADLCRAALSDKKRRGDKITLVLPERIGRCRLETVDVADLPVLFAKATGEQP